MVKNYNLDIVRADDTSALIGFNCGVKSMDDFIHDYKNGLSNSSNYVFQIYGLYLKKERLLRSLH